ncbi:integration host factor subunit beta [Corallococcus coralloides DSM 2259]|uniref:Integration host factor subunit beta n=6 Tax=Corallococcus TaxID=83461 RepID=H8MMF1_CORCM|nr:integration host factor subunit beta [Corallococcus coralloides DSM 2259]
MYSGLDHGPESPVTKGSRGLRERPMLKSDLINILVAKRGVTQKQAEATIETIFESMKDALCRGENIEIRGLGAFHVKNYQGYQGRNPKTGQVIPVKPKRGLLFRTGKELRDRVNRPAPLQAQSDLPPSSEFKGSSGTGTL